MNRLAVVAQREGDVHAVVDKHLRLRVGRCHRAGDLLTQQVEIARCNRLRTYLHHPGSAPGRRRSDAHDFRWGVRGARDEIAAQIRHARGLPSGKAVSPGP